MKRLVVEQVCKRFAEADVLRSVDLCLHDGELVALLGQSGAGKSTLLKIIAGIEAATSGRVRVPGRNGKASGHAVLVWQDLALFRHMSVAENIRYGLRFTRQGTLKQAAIVDHLVRDLQLSGFEDRSVDTLSGGERQRVALARSLAVEPDILLLDEPFGSVDRVLRAQMIDLILRIRQRFQVAMLLVTHDQDEALAVADRIGVLSAGELVQIGTPAQVLKKPSCAEVAELLGNWNVWPVRVLSREGHSLTVDLLGTVRETKIADWVELSSGDLDSRVWYVIGADAVRVGRAGDVVVVATGSDWFEGGTRVGVLASHRELGPIRGTGEFPSEGNTNIELSWHSDQSFALPWAGLERSA